MADLPPGLYNLMFTGVHRWTTENFLLSLKFYSAWCLSLAAETMHTLLCTTHMCIVVFDFFPLMCDQVSPSVDNSSPGQEMCNKCLINCKVDT